MICFWDIQSQAQEKKSIDPLHKFQGHQGSVEDVSWNYINENCFASCGDDKTIRLWDIRSKSPSNQFRAHNGQIYTIAFSPFQEQVLLSGSEDKSIGFWDLRNTNKRLHSFEGHSSDVVKVECSPFNIAFFASSGSDRRIITWDLTKIGATFQEDDCNDGPVEMLVMIFVHGGHKGKVPDLSWNKNQQFVIASVDEEFNFLQIWQMTDTIMDD